MHLFKVLSQNVLFRSARFNSVAKFSPTKPNQTEFLTNKGINSYLFTEGALDFLPTIFSPILHYPHLSSWSFFTGISQKSSPCSHVHAVIIPDPFCQPQYSYWLGPIFHDFDNWDLSVRAATLSRASILTSQEVIRHPASPLGILLYKSIYLLHYLISLFPFC